MLLKTLIRTSRCVILEGLAVKPSEHHPLVPLRLQLRGLLVLTGGGFLLRSGGVRCRGRRLVLRVILPSTFFHVVFLLHVNLLLSNKLDSVVVSDLKVFL